ncbi:hypothetical protein MNBD_DELTA01-333 [hydrothermal vent metagenome]|uniref:Response regulator n=1 Tax=hydrothermal vent metagenome TaxID=652676 RepID=A0A3B0QZK6_9ZZZZ
MSATPEILVVDDEFILRELISEILSRRGWKVDTAESSEKGITRIKEKHYDVVVSDLMMPGISGMEFLKIIKEYSPSTSVLMVTGYPSIDIAVDAIRYGAADFVVKPFSAEKLEFVVRKAIDQAKQYKDISLVNVLKDGSTATSQELAFADKAGYAATADNLIQRPHEHMHRSLEVKTRTLEDKVKELSVLHTISDTLDETKEKGEIFRKIMELAIIITGAERAFVGLVNKDKDELIVRAAVNYSSNSPVGRKFDASREPFKSVIKKMCYSYSFVDDKGFIPLVGNMVAPFDRAPLLTLPIIINGESLVILGLCGKEGLMQFSDDNIAMLLNLATKAALKLENISLANNIFTNILATIDSLINALDARDTYTKDHSHRVTQYALSIATAYGADQSIMDSISFAGPLHDIGKIGVRDDILLKEGSFTTEERNIMKSHALRGEEILKPLNLLNVENAVVLNHHERWDGAGYPEGLKGEEIPVVARIFSVADTFDAMTSSRPYRSALTSHVTTNEILRCSGSQFDPAVVKAFMKSDLLHDFERISGARGVNNLEVG